MAMVVLSICERIEPTCLSKKLGLYISNLSDCPYEGWDELVFEEFIKAQRIAKINTENWEIKFGDHAYDHYKKQFPEMMQGFSQIDDDAIKKIVSNLVCIYFNYEYEDMPMGGWEDNPFDGRLCEKDYAEMIIDFLHFLSNDGNCPFWIYSSNYDDTTPFHKLLLVKNDSERKIAYLKFWGAKIDNYLEERNDYLKLDYLIRAIYDENGYDAYHLSKMYSLCQLFLESKHESELDRKLPQFIDPKYELQDRIEIAKILRQMRNKVAHGDFVAFEKKAEEYAQKFMDGHYSFDYSEYSRQNWVLLNVCCLLADTVKTMIKKAFEDKGYMIDLKKQTFEDKDNASDKG